MSIKSFGSRVWLRERALQIGAGSGSGESDEGRAMSQAGSRAFGFRCLLPAVAAALIALGVCHLVAHPPDVFLTEEQRFVNFTEEVFRSELSGNTLNLHYLVADPSAYGLEEAEVSLGDASPASYEEAYAAMENYRTALEGFDYEKLSDERQLTYDVFLAYLDTELAAADLYLYDEPLDATLGVQAQLPVLLAEYTFRTKGDIEDYLTLLTRIPDYFDSILSFEQAKSEAGLFMSSACAMDVIEQCLDFASDEDCYLIGIFEEKIDAISNLTVDEKIAYKARNQSILTGYVLPAYRNLAEGLASLEDTGTNEMGLYYYPEGQAYYEYLVESTVGDSREIDEIEEAIKTQMVEDYAAIQEILASWAEAAAGADGVEGDGAVAAETEDDGGESAVSAETGDGASENAASVGTDDSEGDGENATSAEIGDSAEENAASADDPAEMLENLRLKITEDFPLLPAVSCEIKYVHQSLQEYLSPAFYLTPTIDDYTSNVIYINPASEYSGLELYTTLAHEGYPGHLYQSVYFASQSPDLLRCILDVGGYTEGWATYVEMYAYALYEGGTGETAASGSAASGSGNTDAGTAASGSLSAEISRLNRSFTLGLASLLDIGIHYHGYTPEEVSAFLTQLGFSETTAESLYTSILASPANYLKYYVGYLDFMELRDLLAQSVEDFSLKEFHRVVLEIGPVPFDILEKECIERLDC